jgi:outer membrane protein assembly factor BamB
VAGDFNRDGKVDLAVANGTSNDVSIFFGSPLGSAAPLPVGGGQKSIATADFDQDGDLDLALARGTSVEIYRNDGSGGFGFLESLPGFTTAQFIAIGDFNEDGDPDLAVADSAAGLVRVFRGRLGNDAGFNALTPASVGTQPRYIAVADLDRNGTLDLAVANQGSDNLTLLSGSGTGSFGAFSGFSPLATGLKPTAVVAGDFNVDGRPDLAVSHLDSSTVAFHIALPTSGFAPARAFPLAGLVVPSLAAGDFNRDGRPDVAAPDTGTTKVAVLLSTSCTATRMGILQQPYSCTSGSPFPLQPKVGVTDDGGNPTYCDGNGNVTATLLGGGSLGGTPERPVANAVADWASGGGPLSVTPGGRFRLKFQHELGYTAVSRSISLDLMVSVSGPTDLCAGQMGSYASNSLGYDRYDWRLDAMPVSVAPTYHMPGQAPGTRFLDLQISQDACFASLISPYVVTVNPDLSPITISVAGGTTICQATGCTGGTATEAPLHTGGGLVTYQWGFRTVSGVSNPITFIPGATNPSYLLNGPDFPGPGVYYLILRMTPACGAVQTSTEVVVTVDNSMLQDIVRFFTVTSKKGENKLEWINPPSPPYPGPTVTVDVHRKASTTNCSLPGDYPNNPFALPLTSVSGTANQKSEYADLAVADGTTYCYTLFVVKVPGTDYSAGRSNRGRPFDNSGGQPQEHIRWAYSVGTTSIVPPGVGVDAIHMAANDNTIHSVTKGEAATSGTWPASWRPFPMNGPSQGRPTTITAGGLGAPKVIYLGSQDGNAYAIDAESGVPLWSKFLAPGMVQAGPSGIFASFGSAWGITYNHILVGTRDGASPNKFYALDASNDGQIVWSQDGVAAGYGRMGIISSQALVDYANQRVYFTSYAFGTAPDDRTVWCVSLGGPIPNPPPGTVIWARAYGNVTTAPTLRGNVLYVGTSDGKVKALDASTGDPVWPADFDTFTGQPIKGHVLPDRLTNELYFSTNDKVWAIRDMVTYGEAKWNFPNGYVALPGASTPVYLPGGLYVYVGDGNGHLHRLEAATGAESPGVPATFPLQLGDGSGIVGSPTLDTRQGFLYVGTDAGVVYAVKLIP